MTSGFGLTVQVAERGQIYTSDDLVFWTPRESGTTNALRATTFFGSRLLVTGENGTALYADSLDDFRLLDLGTSDWLEGVAASPGLAVAVGDNGAVYTSTNGANWVRHKVSFNQWLRGVAYSPEADVFVAVGEQGFIASSGDGKNWTTRNSGTTRNLNRVAWLSTRFLAVGEGGIVLNSAVGQPTGWTPISFPTTNALSGVASDTTASRVVVGYQEVRRRDDLGWLDETDPAKAFPAPKWTYYSCQWLDSLFFAAGRSGLMVEGFRTNATSPWLSVDRFQPVRTWLWDMARAPEFYVTVGDRGTIMTSTDGIDWNLELPPPGITTDSLFLGVAASSNLLVAVGAKGAIAISPDEQAITLSTNTQGQVTTNLTSTMGVVWHSASSPTTNDLQGVALFNRRWIVTGTDGIVLTSEDGTNWSKGTTGVSAHLSSVSAYSDGLVVVGRGGTLLTSPDGAAWTPRNVATTNWLYRVRNLDGMLVVVGEKGTILTSPNGTDWTPQVSGTGRWLSDVAKLGGTYYVCGHQGALLSSRDLVLWQNEGTVTEKSLFAFAQADGQLLVAGVEGAILRSQVLPNLAPVQFMDFNRIGSQNIYLIGGEPDQRFTLDASLNLTDWTTGPLYEFLDSSGTLLIIEETGTNAPAEFYRGTLQP